MTSRNGEKNKTNVFFYFSLIRNFEVGLEAANYAVAKIKMNQDLGDLELGKIDQEYVTDPDLRRMLADTELNSNMMKVFEGCKLRLITKVIYSERFEVKGKRKNEVLYNTNPL